MIYRAFHGGIHGTNSITTTRHRESNNALFVVIRCSKKSHICLYLNQKGVGIVVLYDIFLSTESTAAGCG